MSCAPECGRKDSYILKCVVHREGSALCGSNPETVQDLAGQLARLQEKQDRGTQLAGLRDFPEGKRAASRRPQTASGDRPRGSTRRQRNVSANTQKAPLVGANENAPLRAVIKVEGSTGIRHIRTDDSNFQIIHDFPSYLGGHNLGPIAEEHLLGVMTPCLTHIFEIQAANRGVALDSLRLETKGTLTPRIGSTSQSPRFSGIHYKAYIGSPESKEAVAGLVEAVEGAYPIYNLLRNANEVSGKLVRGPYREQQNKLVATKP